MYRRNLKAIIVAFVLVSGFGIGTAAHVNAADTMSPQGAAQSKSVNQNVATGTKVVTGTVTDPSGETLIGLTVKVSGTNVAVATDLDGNYSIKVPAGSNELEFSYIGYQTIKRAINGQSKIDVVMQDNSEVLDEVVVTAMGITRKESSLTYATQEIKGDDLMKVQDANFVNSLQGKAAGVTITQSAGGAGGTSKILLRGNKSVMGNNSPLIVIDGIPMTNQVGGAASSWAGGESLTYSSSSEGGDALSLINPDDIESINILKGANAAALYGSRAGNGVILITTKKGSKKDGFGIRYSGNFTWTAIGETLDMQRRYGQGHIDTKDAKTAVYDKTDSGSWGPVLDGSMKEAWNGETYAYSNYGDKLKDYFDTGFSHTHNVSISNGTEKSHFRTSFGY